MYLLNEISLYCCMIMYQDVYEAAGDLLYWSGVYLNLFTDT